MTDEELLKEEKRQKWTCPVCKGDLHKHKKDVKKENVLALGVKACHDCESVWFIQKIR